MSILIKGLKMPKEYEFIDLVITGDGVVREYYEGKVDIEIAEAVELPDHGDLKDVNAIIQDVHDDLDRMTKIGIAVDADWIWAKFHDAIYSAPVIIPAERSEE